MSEKLKIGIVIPTLGERQEYLKETIRSSKKYGDVHLLIVAPQEAIHSLKNLKGVDQIIPEEQRGLPAAINWGFRNLPQEIQYIGWIGDDDLLAPDAGKKSAEFLNNNLGFVMTFGQCRYVNGIGKTIGMSAFGQYAVPLLRFGPDLIPQPGSIFRRDVFTKVGEIDTEFKLAFDFELFIRLSKVGKIKAMSHEVGSFRWHGDSKSVKTRKQSVIEASRVRRKHLPIILKPIAFFWEVPVVLATYCAGVLVTYKSQNSVK
jgi:glycosyltransferase involved in cell wall biosynthesis